ncbi:MAG TPA: DUF1570 domain-containing protein [Anaeromyxobacteraceae bacterium]|nr:DUF1570 domain-containing protein [Anaeromyxobacteraceae bacterium]
MGRLPAPAGLSILALAAATACATAPRTFRCPAAGGPPWHEMASLHYVLRTDLPAPEAGELLGKIERLRAAVAVGLPGDGPSPEGRVSVIAFRTLEEYQPFSPEGALGYYIRDEGGPPRIVVPGEIGSWQNAMLAHEITHDFLAVRFRRQPRWFSEGLAAYMETVQSNSSGTTVTVGAPVADRLKRARRTPVPAGELLAWDGGPGERALLDYYATSWLLVHWLVSTRPNDFAAFERQLEAGLAPMAAWQAALPVFDPDRPGALDVLDEELASYARSELPVQRRRGDPLPIVAYFERPMAPPEVHAARLEIWQFGSEPNPRGLRSEIEEALLEDPAHPVALEYLAAVEHADPLPYARRAVAGHPNDVRAQTFLAEALDGPILVNEREAALRRAAQIAPRNVAALHNLAEALLANGKAAEALPVARLAAQLAPWSSPVLAGYAAVLSSLGQCAEAIPVQQRAIDAVPDRGSPTERRALVRKLGAYESQCPPSPGAGE